MVAGLLRKATAVISVKARHRHVFFEGQSKLAAGAGWLIVSIAVVSNISQMVVSKSAKA